ncbi:MAG: 1,6-anhydro-N-acetylmuramyl-L-alanine amidase AmpD [Gammaproteobacteria bacterium]
MGLDRESGCLSEIPFILSPNHDVRPENVRIDLLVIHGISLPPSDFGNPSYIVDFFTNRLDRTIHPYFESLQGVRVSAHLVIFRNGDLIQFVPFTQRAWHAGVSHFQGRSACNDFSIGIELQGTDDIPYTAAQYQALVSVTKAIQQAYPSITSDRIVGHSDIAPGRKTDPGDSFDWRRFLAELEP